MTEDLLAWLSAHEGPWAYLVLGLACLIEYVFPPFPGDTVALFGVFLAVSAGFSAPAVFLALNLGAMVGGLAAYAFGRRFSDETTRPGFLRTPTRAKAIATLEEHYRARGGLYLLANRFVPALRAFFFVAAGIARVPVWQVALYGGLSAIAWNALLFVLGWLAGQSFEVLRGWVEGYGAVILTLALVVAIVVGVRAWRARQRTS